MVRARRSHHGPCRPRALTNSSRMRCRRESGAMISTCSPQMNRCCTSSSRPPARKRTTRVPSACSSTVWVGWKRKRRASGATALAKRSTTSSRASWNVPNERAANAARSNVAGGPPHPAPSSSSEIRSSRQSLTPPMRPTRRLPDRRGSRRARTGDRRGRRCVNAARRAGQHRGSGRCAAP